MADDDERGGPPKDTPFRSQREADRADPDDEAAVDGDVAADGEQRDGDQIGGVSEQRQSWRRVV